MAKKKFIGVKPPQKLFVESEYQGVETVYGHDREYKKYKYEKYCDGLLYKRFPFKNIETSNINPTFEELKLFTKGDDNPEIFSTLLDQTNLKTRKFYKGDKVRVIQGDMMNLDAEIIKIEENKLIARPINTDFSDTVILLPSEVVKVFKKGDYVRVVEGKSAGKEGFVMSMVDDTATIMCDGLSNMIKVFVNDLVFCNDSTRNIQVMNKTNADLQAYSRFDLIKLNDKKTVGIVLAVGASNLKILDNFGNIQTINNLQIETKLNNRNVMARNEKNQTFKIGDSVRILKGKFGGNVGSIKQIYGDVLFLYNTDFTDRLGCIIEKSNNCYLLTSTQPGFGQAGPKGADQIIGKECVIIMGPWKGYKGIAREANEKSVTLELTAKCKKLDVKRELVKLASDLSSTTVSNTDGGRYLDPKTPMIGKGAQSPFFINSPGFVQSPGWTNMASPGYDSKGGNWNT